MWKLIKDPRTGTRRARKAKILRGGICVRCGAFRRSIHRDHILPKWAGGADNFDNWQDLCANCHQDKTIDEQQSPAYRDHVSAKLLGIVRKPLTDDHKAKLSKAITGFQHTDLMKQKQRIAHLGKSKSASTRRRMSVAQKQRRLQESQPKEMK